MTKLSKFIASKFIIMKMIFGQDKRKSNQNLS